jgi:hypothetical protein
VKFAHLTLLFGLFPAAAYADQQAADACAARLPKSSAAIYSASAAQISPGANLRDIVTHVTRSLVMSGDLSRSEARPAAEAAGSCLKFLRK